MQIPNSASELLAALDTPSEPPALRLRLLGYDEATMQDVIEVQLGEDSAQVRASASGFIAAATPLPWGVTLDDLRPHVGRLIGGRPERWQRRNP